jgi:uncharacterized protein (TIGR02677 family)
MPSWFPFAHLQADKAELYRAILAAFRDAQTRFQSYLRPADVLRILRARGHVVDGVDAELHKLADWGNLTAHPDTAEVTTVEDFYRPRFLFQLSQPGEAAERALAVYAAAVEEQGELQTAALEDILRLLEELRVLAGDAPPDAARAWTVLDALRARFEGLVGQARVFMAGLLRAVDLHGVEAERLVAYKERLLQYLERFLAQLVATSASIAELLLALPEAGLERLARAAAGREVADRLDASEAAVAVDTERWLARLDGVRSWFLPQAGAPPQSEELRRRAREAIPALLAAIAAHNERRLARTDRVADLRTLATWFAECESDEDAHRLWRAAFSLAPARHLSVDEDTVAAWEGAAVGASTAWGAAPPMAITPRLRATGRAARKGRPDNVVDRSAERAYLQRWRAEEAAALAAAETHLSTGAPLRLAELGELREGAFLLLLELLGEALAAGTTEVTSADGRFRVCLVAPADGARAVVCTVAGTFTGPDYTITVTRAVDAA